MKNIVNDSYHLSQRNLNTKYSLRKKIKILSASVLDKTGFFNFYLKARRLISAIQVPVLLYHRILPEAGIDTISSSSGMIVLVNTFEKHMKFLSQHYNVISINAFIGAIKQKKTLPSHSAVITFDDGWEDNYLHAYPVLKKYGLPATIFIATDYIDSRRVPWTEKLFYYTNHILQNPALSAKCLKISENAFLCEAYSLLSKNPHLDASWTHYMNKFKFCSTIAREKALECLERVAENIPFPFKENAFLDWNQIKEMSGLLNYGAHGKSHAILTQLDEKEMENEIIGSKKALESGLGVPVKHFAYPNGNYCDTAIKLLLKHGYESAHTTKKGINSGSANLMKIRRINMHERKTLGNRGLFSESLFLSHLANFG